MHELCAVETSLKV